MYFIYEIQIIIEDCYVTLTIQIVYGLHRTLVEHIITILYLCVSTMNNAAYYRCSNKSDFIQSRIICYTSKYETTESPRIYCNTNVSDCRLTQRTIPDIALQFRPHWVINQNCVWQIGEYCYVLTYNLVCL